MPTIKVKAHWTWSQTAAYKLSSGASQKNTGVYQCILIVALTKWGIKEWTDVCVVCVCVQASSRHVWHRHQQQQSQTSTHYAHTMTNLGHAQRDGPQRVHHLLRARAAGAVLSMSTQRRLRGWACIHEQTSPDLFCCCLIKTWIFFMSLHCLEQWSSNLSHEIHEFSSNPDQSHPPVIL